MSNDMYFIQIIAKALEQKNSEESLKQAFDEIKSLGSEPGYEQGFRQFQRFMDTINDQAGKKEKDTLDADFVSELIVDLATDFFEGSDEDKQRALSIIKSNPRLREEYDQLVTDIEQLNRRPAGVEISISRDNKWFKSVTLMEIPGSKGIDRIAAGIYNISFATGQVIWEGELTVEDLVWAKAYPDRPFDLAADTTGLKPEPTKEISVFDGEITIQIFPSIESGSMKITINKIRDSQ